MFFLLSALVPIIANFLIIAIISFIVKKAISHKPTNTNTIQTYNGRNYNTGSTGNFNMSKPNVNSTVQIPKLQKNTVNMSDAQSEQKKYDFHGSFKNNDFDTFKDVILDSGKSSYMLNQNVYSPSNATEQKLSLALCVTDDILKGKGAYRVHGGGFAGTIQAFVPNDILDTYKTEMEKIFGEGSCHVLIIRPVGGTRVI